jgi:hypothetical protein
VDPEIYKLTTGNALNTIGGIQDRILNQLLGTRTLGKLIDAEAALGNKAYQMTELLADLKKGIWSELSTRKPVDVYRRNLQKSYASVLMNLIAPARPTSTSDQIAILLGAPGGANTDKSDIKSVVRAHLTTLRAEINAAAAGTSDPMTKYHLQDVSKRIDNALNPNN